jgi:hypothetical protein
MVPFSSNIPINIDTQEPLLNWLSDSLLVVNESACGLPLTWKFGFNSEVSASSIPQWSGLPNGMSLVNYSFSNPDTLICIFNTTDLNEEFNGLLDIQLSGIVDDLGNEMSNGNINQVIQWDTKAPKIQSVSLWNASTLLENNPVLISESDIGNPGIWTLLQFSERMDTTQMPSLIWSDPALVADLTIHHSAWVSEDSLEVFWNVVDNDYNNFSVDLNVTGYEDVIGNVKDSIMTAYAQWVMMLLGPIQGCTDSMACNYLAFANVDDGTCLIEGSACDDGNAMTTNDVITADCQCQGIAISIEEEIGHSWLIYPNPAMDVLYSNTTGVMECFNALGQLVWSGKISANEPLTIENWSPGLYWIRFGNQSRAWLKGE